MKKYQLLSILLFWCCITVSAQKIQYSKGSVKIPGTGYVRLIADVNGFHHLIHFPVNKKPSVSVFNEQLQLHTTIELNIKLPENCDVRLLKIKNYYILYAHLQNTSKHQLIKINGNGTSSDISSIVNNPADSLWNRSTGTFQLFNNNDSLFIISHSYHNQVKKIKTTIVKFNPELNLFAVSQMLFPFDLDFEELKEATVYKNNLLILKTSKDEDAKNTLTLFKLDLRTGKLLSKQFESGEYLYYSPSVRYNTTDSSIFVYSMLTAPFGYRGARAGMFMVRLNSSLNEITPIRIIQNIFRDNTVSTFIVEKTKTSGWISFSNIQKNNGLKMNPNSRKTDFSDFNNMEADFRYSYSYDNYTNQNSPTAVRMTLLNNRLEKAKDSLVKNNGSYYKIHPSPYAQFILHNTPYLLLVQELAPKRKGLLLVYPNENGYFETVSIRAYNRFNFLLPLLQPVDDNYFIVPFTDKKDMGLMKVTLNN